MTKEDFIKFHSQGNSRVSVNKVIKNFEGRLQPKSAYCVKGDIVQEILDGNIINKES